MNNHPPGFLWQCNLLNCRSMLTGQRRTKRVVRIKHEIHIETEEIEANAAFVPRKVAPLPPKREHPLFRSVIDNGGPWSPCQ